MALCRSRFLALIGALVVAGSALMPPLRAAAAVATPGAPTPASAGSWLVASDGGVFAFGAPFYGSMGGQRLNRPVVGMASTPTGGGYWLVASDGGIFAFGDARFFGSTGGLSLVRPVVGMATTPSGGGYWLVASDGGVFAFGDAGFFGSAGGQRLVGPVVGLVATPSGLGYWLVGADGAVLPFGDAAFYGDRARTPKARAMVGMAATPGGLGYWLADDSGGVFAYGDAAFAGAPAELALAGRRLTAPMVGLAATPRGMGYWLVGSDGGVFAYGDANFSGSLGGLRLVAPIVGGAARPVVFPSEVSIFSYPWYGTVAHDGAWAHWDQAGHRPAADIGANFYPAGGLYSSRDLAVVAAQAREMSAIGVDEVVSSWWGRGSFEDHKLRDQIAAFRSAGLDFAIHLEPYAGRSPGTVAVDLAYLRGLGVRDVYLYLIEDRPAAEWAAVVAAFPDLRFFATGKVARLISGSFSDFARAAGFDGIYTYDPISYSASGLALACARARQRRLLCAPSVSPGFDSRRAVPGFQKLVPAASGQRYDETWTGAIGAGADVVSITSWNEWHEGTQIEPARPYCFSDGYCSPGYDGVYGRSGTSAQRAYLDRTASWTSRFDGLRP